MTASRTASPLERCEQCGDPIETTRWHPVVIERDAERLFAFCGRECQERWQHR